MKGFIKKIRFFFEFTLIKIIFIFLYLLPVNITSAFGSRLLIIFVRFSKSHYTAIQNCKHVFPNLNDKEIKKIIFNSWSNLGKTIFELGILKKIIKKNNYIKIEGLGNINKIIRNKTPSIFFSIHQSNWEICVPSLDKMGINVGAIYRHINNHFIDNFVFEKRTSSLQTKNSFYTPKGKQSAKEILEAVKNNNSIFLLIDQKDSAGEDVILFNKPAKTQTGFIKIARKFNMPLIPIENKRLKSGKYIITFHEPILHNNAKLSDNEIMLKIHSIIEKWIINNPTQWFWQHNRFN